MRNGAKFGNMSIPAHKNQTSVQKGLISTDVDQKESIWGRGPAESSPVNITRDNLLTFMAFL